MTNLAYISLNVLLTLLRVLPVPVRTGLVRIGHPGRNAPVFLTGNYRLTVERVKRALQDLDAYLLVANSKGFNVWCASTGGHLTSHDVVSVLKTSGIDALVDHRAVILPQLAATGVEAGVIHEKTGWTVVWGPVQATAIPPFLHSGREKTAEMRLVKFPWPQRVEMAVAWAFPISLLALLLLPIWQRGVLPLTASVWGLSFLIFLSFPLYRDRLRTERKHMGFVFFDFGRHGVLLSIWGLTVLALFAVALALGHLSWDFAARWGLASFVVVLILGLDLAGSTPIYKSRLHDERLLRITLDSESCEGAGCCEQVCPADVFEIDRVCRLATLPGRERCVQCGACIVQCPCDALFFKGPSGAVVSPDTVRRFKLNMLGRRSVLSREED